MKKLLLGSNSTKKKYLIINNNIFNFIKNFSLRSYKSWFINHIYDERQQWSLWLVASFIFGIGFYFRFLNTDFIYLSSALFAVLLPTVFFYRKYLILIGLFFLLGINVSAIRNLSVDTKILPHAIKNVWVKGHVESINKKPDGKVIYITENNKIYKNLILVDKLRVVARKHLANIKSGDYINFKATIIPPKKVKEGEYNFARHDFYREISGTAFVKNKIKILKQGSINSYWSKLENLRNYISTKIRQTIGIRIGALASALIVGDKSSISKQDYQNIQISGLSHIFAVSGLHLTLIAVISFFAIRYSLSFSVSFSQRYSSKKFAATITLAIALFYLFITGLQVSAIRAYIMICLVMIAIIFDIFPDLKRAIAFAAFAMLLFRPEFALQPGFQLSFIATLALIAAYEIYQKTEHNLVPKNKIIFYFSSVLFSTVVATIATSMFVIYHFHFISNYSVLANLAVNPIVGFLIMPFVVVYFIFFPIHLDWLALIPIKYGLQILLKTTQYISSLKYSTINNLHYSDYALFTFTFGIFWVSLWRGSIRFLGIPVMLFSFMI